MSDNSFETSFKAISDKLVALAKEQGVLATPIEVGDTTIIPVSELRVGFGGAGGQGTGEGECDTGQIGHGKAIFSAGGGNVKVSPVAFIVIDGDTVKMETVDDEGGKR